MPNSTPPRARRPRGPADADAGHAPATTLTTTTAASAATSTPAHPRGADQAPAGMPAAWAGIADLLGAAAERSPADALTLGALSATAAPATTVGVTLAGVWAPVPAAAAAHSRIAVRALDEKGRLSLPLKLDETVKLHAERDATVLTVFLPGSALPRRRTRTVAEIPLSNGRLTLPKGVRAQLGIPDRADVLATIDSDQQTITLTAASRLDSLVLAELHVLRGRPDTAHESARQPDDAAPLRLVAGTGRAHYPSDHDAGDPTAAASRTNDEPRGGEGRLRAAP